MFWKDPICKKLIMLNTFGSLQKNHQTIAHYQGKMGK
jgi:hypothetical protein